MNLTLSRLDDSKFFVIKNTDAAELRTCMGSFSVVASEHFTNYRYFKVRDFCYSSSNMICRNLFDLCDDKYVHTGITGPKYFM